MTFKVGDKVRIVRSFEGDEKLESFVGWADEMAHFVNDGNVYEIKSVNEIYEYVDLGQWVWPFCCVELVVDPVVEKQLSEILEDALMWRACLANRHSNGGALEPLIRRVKDAKEKFGIVLDKRPDCMVPKNPKDEHDSSS